MISAPSKVERFEFPVETITAETLRLMAQVLVHDSKDPKIRTRLRALYQDLPSMDYDGEVAAVWRHVLDHVRYMRDPVTAEHITWPSELERQIVEEDAAAEDCESIVAYAGALLSAGGLKVLFDVMATNGAEPDSLNHVALLVQNPTTKEWISFDAVGAQRWGEDDFPLGASLWKPGRARERWNISGEKEPHMEDEDLSLFGDCGCAMGDVGDTADTVMTLVDTVGRVAPAFGPYGQIVGGLIQVGEGIYSAKTGKQFGYGGAPIATTPPKVVLGYGAQARAKQPPPASSGVGAGGAIALGAGALLGLKLLAVI